MTGIGERISYYKRQLPETARLVAVSKFHPVEMLSEAYDAGQRVFGESRVQELIAKREMLPDDIEWHFIGSLQTNKVKQIVPFVSMIHAIDSERLLLAVEKAASAIGREVRCLLQIHIAREETKHGFSFVECRGMLDRGIIKELKFVRICGLMGMATFTDDREEIAREFGNLQNFYMELKEGVFSGNNDFCELSMGMTEDYVEAVKYGSTMVRIGSGIFGERI
ncbi:YggS family pyridoxal phosphate-dependent enzyme [Barnesiella propionica]|uniref:YggS family pyridoxal phosphate-dependent enzyme n=1 Tax=Barnesiella propionica TaxID=2981781 RepID=UPI0011CBB938|nr:YggS family pyridoxal phosphate-dependent enzyme [Barnesiella propionica]MCU6768266.1 YggS family pyridoxal phosphate-dependent enzyme [Barnesiella propionica]